MRTLFCTFALSCLSASALAQTTVRPTNAQLGKAIEQVSGRKLAASSLRVRGCHGPEEEPTEFECSWSQRTDGRWRRMTGWFFVDADGWHSKCPVGHSME